MFFIAITPSCYTAPYVTNNHRVVEHIQWYLFRWGEIFFNYTQVHGCFL